MNTPDTLGTLPANPIILNGLFDPANYLIDWRDYFENPEELEEEIASENLLHTYEQATNHPDFAKYIISTQQLLDYLNDADKEYEHTFIITGFHRWLLSQNNTSLEAILALLKVVKSLEEGLGINIRFTLFPDSTEYSATSNRADFNKLATKEIDKLLTAINNPFQGHKDKITILGLGQGSQFVDHNKPVVAQVRAKKPGNIKPEDKQHIFIAKATQDKLNLNVKNTKFEFQVEQINEDGVSTADGGIGACNHELAKIIEAGLNGTFAHLPMSTTVLGQILIAISNLKLIRQKFESIKSKESLEEYITSKLDKIGENRIDLYNEIIKKVNDALNTANIETISELKDSEYLDLLNEINKFLKTYKIPTAELVNEINKIPILQSNVQSAIMQIIIALAPNRN